MSQHEAKITWRRGELGFGYRVYSRDHSWEFPHGAVIQASAAPKFLGSADCMDPEEAFVASLSSCHMLTFLAICSHKDLVVEEYMDTAVGFLEQDAEGKLVITRVQLRPKVRFAETVTVTHAELEALHEASHHECFLANSVKTVITTVLEEVDA